MSAVLKFPKAMGGPGKPGLKAAPPPEFLTIKDSLALHELAKSVSRRARALVDFVGSDRRTARLAGIETVSMEALALLEGHRFAAVIDELEYAAEQGVAAQITPDGMERISHLERLVSEAASNTRKYAGRDIPGTAEDAETDLSTNLTTLGQKTTTRDPMSAAMVWAPIVLGALAFAAALFFFSRSSSAEAY